jgi:uncharacterized protein YbjQ (UPF0145 family)
VSSAWEQGYATACRRMVEEAKEAGAHGVVGVVDAVHELSDEGVREYHLTGTAVVVDGLPRQEQVWTSYPAGQRLAKLLESGLVPTSVVSAVGSVRMWAVCATQQLMRGDFTMGQVPPGSPITQYADAQTQARSLARDSARAVLDGDTLVGVRMEVTEERVGRADLSVECILRGTRVRRYKAAEPPPLPRPTVTLW